jgi:hypothetical protein
MPKRLTPQAILALQEALALIYHYKNDLRRFLEACGVERPVLSQAPWDAYKRQIATEIVEVLLRDQATAVLTKLCRDVSAMDNFDHLLRLEDGPRKVAVARAAVAELRRLVQAEQKQEDDEQVVAERRQRRRENEEKTGAFQRRLSNIRLLFNSAAVSEGSPQKRGAELEALMTDLFELFDLDPRASFRISGEQIDGAFTLDGTDYLFEAKWEKAPLDRTALDEFVSKIGRKLDNTLGLLLSMSGFKTTAVEKYSDRRATILLMESYDLQAVLEQKIDFVEMLRRKRRHAAETGNIFFPVYPTVLFPN